MDPAPDDVQMRADAIPPDPPPRWLSTPAPRPSPESEGRSPGLARLCVPGAGTPQRGPSAQVPGPMGDLGVLLPPACQAPAGCPPRAALTVVALCFPAGSWFGGKEVLAPSEQGKRALCSRSP